MKKHVAMANATVTRYARTPLSIVGDRLSGLGRAFRLPPREPGAINEKPAPVYAFGVATNTFNDRRNVPMDEWSVLRGISQSIFSTRFACACPFATGAAGGAGTSLSAVDVDVLRLWLPVPFDSADERADPLAAWVC